MSREELEKLSRAELDALASEQGLDPEQFNNKGQVVEALLGETSEDNGADDEEQEKAPAKKAKAKAESGERPGHPVHFDASGNPVYRG